MRSLLLLASGAALALQIPQAVGPAKSSLPPPKLTHEMAEVLSHMRIVEIDEPFGYVSKKVKVLRIGGVNVQIVNDPVDAYSSSGSTNGLGNLILGWNYYQSTAFVLDRSGSHNLVFGHSNGYEGAGGIVSGTYNRILGENSAVLGGMSNAASNGGVVVGGSENLATGSRSAVGGGYGRSATGDNDWAAGSLFQDF